MDVVKPSICPTQDQIDAETKAIGTARAVIRNEALRICVNAINGRYTQFKSALHKESSVTNLVTDVLSLGLSGGATIAGTSAAAPYLSGAATFVTGTDKSIDKDVFYQQTLPAIEAAMDTRRNKILATIQSSENDDPADSKYTLIAAGADIDALQAAGSMYSAISDLTATANKAQAESQKVLDAAKTGAVIDIDNPVMPPSNIIARTRALIVRLDALNPDADQDKLSALASKLNLTFTPDPNASASQNFVNERGQINAATNKAIDTQPDSTEMTILEGFYNSAL